MEWTLIYTVLIIVTLHIAVSGGFFAYIADNPRSPSQDDQLKKGIGGMAGISLIGAVLLIILLVKLSSPNNRP